MMHERRVLHHASWRADVVGQVATTPPRRIPDQPAHAFPASPNSVGLGASKQKDRAMP